MESVLMPPMHASRLKTCTHRVVRVPVLGLGEVILTQPLVAAGTLKLSDLTGRAHAAGNVLGLDGVERTTGSHGTADLILQLLLALVGVRGRRLDLATLAATDPASCQDSAVIQ